MKKNCVILIVAMGLLHSFAFSQKAKPVVKPKTTAKPVRTTTAVKQPVIKDTLAYNIQTTLNELNAYITDNSLPAQSMVGNYIREDVFRRPEYSSVIEVPRSAENTICRQSIDRYKGTELWEWKSIILRSAKGQLPAATFVSLKFKIDSIVKAMPAIKESNEKNSIFKVYVYENVSEAKYRHLYKADEVGIQIQFTKPVSQTEQQAIDSLVKVYRPGLYNANTAHVASDKFTHALSVEGISKEKSEMIFADEVKLLADKDIKAAFQMLMGTSLDQTKLIVKLNDGQRSEIRKLAAEVVNAYNAQWDPPRAAPATTDPGSGSSTFAVTQQVPQKQGKRVKCSVCNGVGQYEKLIRSHTYDGVYNQVTTNVTKWVVCEVCNGGGWVTKYKN